jgi:hypothetical protein
MKNNLINAGMIVRLVMAEAAPAALPNLAFAQADIRHEVFGPIARRIDGPITVARAGKRINLEMNKALATKVVSASSLTHCLFNIQRCRFP